MTEKHTPGPWGVTHSGEGYPMIHGPEATDPTTEARYHFIATLMPCPSNLYQNGKHRTTDGIAEREANARLIASAPTLKAENERLREALNVTREALVSALNLEMHVTKAEQHVPACKGLDVEYHFDLIRAAISVATPFEAQN